MTAWRLDSSFRETKRPSTCSSRWRGCRRLLEASRQVHSTIHEDEVLEQVLRIVVRELEMAGAAFLGTKLSYGDLPDLDLEPPTACDQLASQRCAPLPGSQLSA
jgi:hypothetical protein